MGADLLLAYTKAPATVEGLYSVDEDIFDDTIRHRVGALTTDDLAGIATEVFGGVQDDSESIEQIRQFLLAAARDITSQRRDVTYLTLDGKTYLFTGGMSWGDDPTDAWPSLVGIGAAGLFDKPFGVPGKRFSVSDSKGIEPGEKCLFLGTFDTEQEASEFIATLPEYESGRYSLDDMQHPDSGS